MISFFFSIFNRHTVRLVDSFVKYTLFYTSSTDAHEYCTKNRCHAFTPYPFFLKTQFVSLGDWYMFIRNNRKKNSNQIAINSNNPDSFKLKTTLPNSIFFIIYFPLKWTKKNKWTEFYFKVIFTIWIILSLFTNAFYSD